MDSPDAQPMIELATSYWRSATLLAANRLKIFEHLGTEGLSAIKISERCGSDLAATEMLLRGLCSMGLLMRVGDSFSNSPDANAFLVPGKPTYLGEALEYMQDVYQAWGNLAESVKSGAPAMSQELQLGGDPAVTQSFVRGMHNRALAVAPGIVNKVDLVGRKRLLDVGGGPGTYSLLLCRKYPDLQSEVLDLPAVVDVARDIAIEWGMESRVQFRCGSYLDDDFGNNNDAVLMSGILHRETPDTCRGMIQRAADSLNSGGCCVAADVFLNEQKDGPEMSTLFALNMFLTSDCGGAHAWTEVETWMREAGLTDFQTVHLEPPAPHTLVIAHKK